MESLILALLGGGERRPRGDHRFRSEDWKFLHHNAQIAVGAGEIDQRLEHSFAVSALIIEELDKRYIALGISENWIAGITLDRLAQRRHPFGLQALLSHLLPLLHALEGFHDHFRVPHDVVADQFVQDLFLAIAKGRLFIAKGGRNRG